MSTGTEPARVDVVPSASPRGRWSRRRGLTTLGVLALLVAVGVLAWIWRHPTSPFDTSYGLGVERARGEPVWTTLITPGEHGDDTVTLRGLTPRTRLIPSGGGLARPGPPVEVEYVLCEIDPDVADRPGLEQSPLGQEGFDLDSYCASTRPAEGATLEPGSVQQEVIVGITLDVPGRVAVRGHVVDYQKGWQVGTDVIPVRTWVQVRPRR
ncbi:hypothetical protein G7072_04430 [Nocardioides sp. HDW12B]|uniref:hypothetical protein n=1 Tax=Nocardioides sp. HDW12B TaxID=2714939 RepID=UPI00140D5958|nr:hypothetical protein [Nocardioides sp. HDW12B]QIK65688.1 hypothetical protein G7072_04430 [Nocardioides sp. HDW12B]